MDAAKKGEGIVHIAAPLTEKIIREECSSRIEDYQKNRVGQEGEPDCSGG